MKRILFILLLCTIFGASQAQIIRANANPREQVSAVEECDQNLVEYSEELDNAYWAKANITVVANQANDLEGNATLDELTMTAAAVNIRSYDGGAYTPVSASTTYRFSFDAKRGTSTKLEYSVYDWTAGTVPTHEGKYLYDIATGLIFVIK